MRLTQLLSGRQPRQPRFSGSVFTVHGDTSHRGVAVILPECPRVPGTSLSAFLAHCP